MVVPALQPTLLRDLPAPHPQPQHSWCAPPQRKPSTNPTAPFVLELGAGLVCPRSVRQLASLGPTLPTGALPLPAPRLAGISCLFAAVLGRGCALPAGALMAQQRRQEAALLDTHRAV